MGGLSIWHILIVALLFVLLFGKGKISDLMGDVAKGVKNFKEGMAEDEPPAPPEKPVRKTTRKPRAKAAPKPKLAIEDKTEKKTATTTARRRKTTKS